MDTSWPISVNMYQSSTKFTTENSRSTFSLGRFRPRLVGAHIPEGLDMHQITKLSTSLIGTTHETPLRHCQVHPYHNE